MKKLNVPLTVLEHTKQCNNDFSCLASEEYKGFGDCEAAYLTMGDNILFLKSTEPYNVCSFRDTHSNNRQACSCPTRFYSFSKRKNTKAILKQCGLCLETWESCDDFLGDPDITLVGYQVAFQSLETGLSKTIRWYIENEKWVRHIKTGEYLSWIRQHYGQG